MRTFMALFLLAASLAVLATPSTLVYIPSTDIQPTGVWHLGADSYVFTGEGAGSAFVDTGLTYGVIPRVEAGIDLTSNTANPLWLNAKVLLLSPDTSPVALAVGAYNFSTTTATRQNLLYGIASTTFSGIRLTGGYYTGSKGVMDPDQSGILLGVDRTVGKYWLGADFQGGKNPVGAWNVGVGYALTDKIGFIIGYDHYHLQAIKPSLNFQLDANL